ncbi:MAG: hypothetical protein KDB00_29590 [Planctomycetales bacterium]|nr:hypothetical protein [Planctomycetales bacterium]
MQHSLPYKMAGGPFRQSDVQGALGTHGSVDAPPMEVSGAAVLGANGVRHFGGAAGSGNAGSGNEKGRQFSGSPNLRRQLCNLPSPAEPGNASVVVAGNGLKIRCPVGSIAGNRNREHPKKGSVVIANRTHHINRPLIAQTYSDTRARNARARVHLCVNETGIGSC